MKHKYIIRETINGLGESTFTAGRLVKGRLWGTNIRWHERYCMGEPIGLEQWKTFDEAVTACARISQWLLKCSIKETKDTIIEA